MKNLKKIKGDASFREFYRKKGKKTNSIIVLAKKEKFKNLIIYEAINRIFNKNKILAPKLFKENYKKNYNLRVKPAEILIKGKNISIIRKRQSIQDII